MSLVNIFRAVMAFVTAGSLFGAELQKQLKDAGPDADFYGWMSRLDDQGYRLAASYDAEVWSNLDGGIQTGTEFIGVGFVEGDFDMEKIAGLEGASFFASGAWYEGRSPTDKLIGADPSTYLSAIEADRSFWRFYRLYYEQKIGDSPWALRIGQLAADEVFMLSEYAGLFLNAQFGAMPSMADNLAAPIYPLPAPGALLLYEPDEGIFARLGVYTADAGQNTAGNIGFDWRLGGDAGGALFFETGIAGDILGREGRYTLGFVGANNQTVNYRTGANATGFYSFYFMADRVIETRENGAPSLAGFFRFAYNPQSGHSQQQYYADFGVNWFAPFPNRENDVAGIAVGYNSYYDAFRQSSASAGQPVTPDQTVIELTYQFEVYEWFKLQPDFQIFLNPQFSGRDAYVIGLNANLFF